MHAAAFNWCRQFASPDRLDVLDLGGRYVNGSCHPHFPAARFTVLDIEAGAGVDIVADAATWVPDEPRWDVVLINEVFEHTPDGKAICRTAFEALRPGGRVIITCGGPGRAEHSGHDGGPLKPCEYYGNVDPEELGVWLQEAGFTEGMTFYAEKPCDTYGWGVKP
jgi:SAM-dependent methyltransferase